MEYDTIFDLVSKEFSEAQIPFLVVGGFGVMAHGVVRGTTDVDFAIRDDHYSKAAAILARFDYEEEIRTDIFARFKNPKSYPSDVDLLFVDMDTFLKMKEEGKNFKIAGNDFRVPSLYHMLAMKIHALNQGGKNRELKDLDDVVKLIKKNKVNIQSSEFKELCLKHGNAELYGRICSYVE